MTTVTLRKAAAIQTAILEKLALPMYPSRIEVDSFVDLEESVRAATDKLAAQLDEKAHLTDALRVIRKAVAHANMQCGVSDLLTEIALLDRSIRLLSELANSPVRTVPLSVERQRVEQLNARLDKAITHSSLYRDSTVSVSLYTEEDINALKESIADLRKKRSQTQEEVLRLNVVTTIDLSAIADTLVKQRLV